MAIEDLWKETRNPFDLRDFQKAVVEWAAYNFGNQDKEEPFLGLVEEMGELSHAFLKLRQGIRGDVNDHLDEIRDAIGDWVIFCAAFCDKMGLDLEDCISKTWGEVRGRDWKKYPENGITK